MTAIWRNLPEWGKGLLAQILSWGIFSLYLSFPTFQDSASHNVLLFISAQGLLAGLLCHLFKLHRWWWIISLLFLPAVSLAHKMQLSPRVYLWAFIMSLAFFWSILYRGAPLYLSGPKAWAKVKELLPKDHAFRFVDLGSGLGGLAINLSRQYPNGEFHGIEFAPAPWLISKIRNWVSHGKVAFIRRDYRKIDLGAYDIVFAFLSPIVMKEVIEKAKAEMRPGSLLLSLAFPLPGVHPDFTLKTDGDTGHLLYGWRA